MHDIVTTVLFRLPRLALEVTEPLSVMDMPNDVCHHAFPQALFFRSLTI